MSFVIKSAIGAFALACAASSSAATITYSSACPQFCAFAKLDGTVTSVRIQQRYAGYQIFEPRPFFMGVSTYRVTGYIDVLGGIRVPVDQIQETTTALYTSADIDQLLTGDLSYFSGAGYFSAGSAPNLSYTLLSGPALGPQFRGIPSSGDITLTINYIAAVPELATWAMMLVGFGMIGAATRYGRKRTAVSFA